MAEETDICASYLASTMAADTAGAGSLDVLAAALVPSAPLITQRIYDSLADQEQDVYPVVVFSMQAALDDLALNNAKRVWASYLFQVKVIGKNHSYAQLSPIASRIDTLIHRGAGTVTGGAVIACTRDRTVRYPEPTDGVIYRHLGGVYRLIAQSS